MRISPLFLNSIYELPIIIAYKNQKFRTNNQLGFQGTPPLFVTQNLDLPLVAQIRWASVF